MTASGRAADGRVRSVIADHIERLGADGFFAQVQRQPMSFFNRVKIGRIIGRVTSDIEALRVGIQDVIFVQLGEWVNAVLFDNRVYLAHHKCWPPAADRFAADLGWVDAVQDGRLHALTAAALACRAPVIMGGYGVVSGGLYAMLEGLPPQPAASAAQN